VTSPLDHAVRGETTRAEELVSSGELLISEDALREWPLGTSDRYSVRLGINVVNVIMVYMCDVDASGMCERPI